MALCSYPYYESLTLIVSPHRAGLTVEEARRLIESINTNDMETETLRVSYSLTEIAETLIAPGLSLPDPHPGTPVAAVETSSHNRPVSLELQQELLRRWEEAYAQATLHESL